MVPLVPVPDFLVVWLPAIFAAEQSQAATFVGGMLCLIAGLGYIMPPLLNGENSEVDRQFVVVGVTFLVMSIMFFVAGAYIFFLTIVAAIVISIIWICKRIKQIFNL